jgi:hypothetical protein
VVVGLAEEARGTGGGTPVCMQHASRMVATLDWMLTFGNLPSAPQSVHAPTTIHTGYVTNRLQYDVMLADQHTRYSPLTNQWSWLPPNNLARFEAAGVVHEGKLYIVGGADSYRPLKSVEVYDLATDAWTTLPSKMPVAVSASRTKLLAPTCPS